MLGYIGASIGFLLIGGSSWLPFVVGQESFYIVVGLAVVGGVGGMISIPILPEMMEVYETDEVLSNKYDTEQV